MDENNRDFASALEAMNQIGSPLGSESEEAPVDMDDFASAIEAMNQIGIPEESLSVMKEDNDIPDIDIKDISKIKAFGKFLDETGKSLADIHHQLNVQAKQVCEGWGDDKNRRLLMNNLERSQDKIDELVKEMQGYSSYINQLCKTLDIWKENNN